MKKIPVIISLFVILTVSLQAQFMRSYGFKAGITSSKMDANYIKNNLSPNPDAMGGFTAGVFAEFLNIPFISIIGDLSYKQLSIQNKLELPTAQSIQGTGVFSSGNNTFDYLSLSMLAKFRMSYPVLCPYAFIGPSANFEISKDIIHGYDLIFKDYSKSLWNLAIGAGIELKIPYLFGVLGEFQYNIPLNTPYKTDLLEIKNNSYELKAGILF
ncbi:MAG: outer membrane beta-barrel protein [Ignavibacteria bacterium]